MNSFPDLDIKDYYIFADMKTTKTILFAIALICTALVNYACNPEKKGGRAMITVNTAAIYDELGTTDPMKERALATQGFTIVDTLLIYDQQGFLVSKLGVETKEIKPVTFEATGLKDGTYTFVVWQSASSDEFGSAWFCSDEDKLATSSIITDSPMMSYQFALGYDLTTAAVGGGRVKMELSPKTMGCIVDLRAENFPAEPEEYYLYFENSSQPVPCGVRLDPALGEGDRLILADDDYTAIAYVQTSDPSYRHFTLAHDVGEPFYFWTWDGEQEEFAADLINTQMQRGGYYVCYFDLGRRSWQPPFFGTPDDFDAWKADRDAGLLVADPVLDWGCNFDKVERHINAKQWWRPGNGKFEYWGEEYGCWHIWYSVAYQLTEQYLFETEDGKNLRYAQCCSFDDTLPTDVAKNSLLKQGYVYKGRIQYPGKPAGDCLISADGKTQAEVYVYEDGSEDGGWWIEYQPTNPDTFGYISCKAPAPGRESVRESREKAALGAAGSRHPATILDAAKYHLKNISK